MLLVVSGCDEKYAPGCIALWNSIKRNVPDGEIDYRVLAYGEQSLIDELQSHGITVLDNPQFPPDTNFPKGGRWEADAERTYYPEGINPSEYAMPAMYSRILITELFPDYERALWVDADCLVMQSIAELEEFDFGGHVLASTDIQPNGNFKSLQPLGANKNSLGYRAHGTGTMLVNIPAWRDRRITEQCIELMNSTEDGEWLAVVQSALILVVRGDFAEYGWEYMWDSKRNTIQPNTKIAHFPIVIPWDREDVLKKPPSMQQNVSRYWAPYEG